MLPFKVINDHGVCVCVCVGGRSAVIKHLACCVQGSGIWNQTPETLKKEREREKSKPTAMSHKGNMGKVKL